MESESYISILPQSVLGGCRSSSG